MTKPKDKSKVLEAEPDKAPQAPSFSLVLTRACSVALWADGSMAKAERNAVGQLVASIAKTKREQEMLMQLALKDLNRHEVLDDVAKLDPGDRLHLFERCLAVVGSDRKIARQELRFLSELRRSCGVGLLRYQRLIYRQFPLWRRVFPIFGGFVIIGLVLLATAWLAPLDTENEPPVVPQLKGPEDAEVHPRLLLPAPDPALSVLDSEALFEAVRRSMVTVHVRLDGRLLAGGSGAVIGIDDGRNNYFVVTNRHVIYHEVPTKQQLTFDVEFENQARFDAVLDFTSKRYDLALLAVLGTPLWAQPVAMRMKDTLNIGEPVYALGSPLGLENTFTSGLISALRDNYIQTDATVHSGSSGGPLFDKHGLLCGVVTLSHESKDLSFALVADTVIDMLRERHAASGDAPND